MANVLMSDDERNAFLLDARLGILITLRKDGTPIGIPVWFEWNGEVVSMFAGKDSNKVARLKNNPTASLLVTNRVGEPESWIAFDGEVGISDSGGIELAEKLAPRYWDMSDANRAAELAIWREYADTFCLLTLTPSRIRTGS